MEYKTKYSHKINSYIFFLIFFNVKLNKYFIIIIFVTTMCPDLNQMDLCYILNYIIVILW